MGARGRRWELAEGTASTLGGKGERGGPWAGAREALWIPRERGTGLCPYTSRWTARLETAGVRHWPHTLTSLEYSAG